MNAEKRIGSTQVQRLLKLASKSKDDFLRAFRQLGQAGGAQGYSLILSEMEKAVAGGDASSFKAMSEAVRWVHSAAPAGTLAGSCSPSGGTNFLILACKHNRVEILKYLLEDSDGTSQDATPGQLDDEGHDAAYYAVRSGNVELLETIITKWPGGHFADHPEELEQALAAAYDELKMKNVLLSDEMELFVQTKLLNLRFFCTVKKANMSSGHIVERIQLVLEKIRTLRAECSLAGVDVKFIYTAAFVAQNINILKQQLKSTYAVLPWEEMEFCLVCFISAHTRCQELNIFIRSVLSKENVLGYLDIFSNLLESLIQSIITSNVYALGKPIHLNRDEVIADILNRNNGFRGLYSSYKEVRDVYSLQVMKRYIDAALLSDCGTKEGQLTIKRALQVMGEHLKNSLESPKLSEDINELLLLSAPSETRKILTNLRNSLSKTHFLRDEETKEECKLYANLQNDISKVGVVISDILFSKKIEKKKSFLTKIIESNSLDEMDEIVEVFQDMRLDLPKSNQENQIPRENQRIFDLIKEIDNKIVEKSNYEKDLFKQINETIHKSENNSIQILLGDYIMFFGLLRKCDYYSNKIHSKCTENNILKVKKHTAKQALLKISPKANPLGSKNTKLLITLLCKFRESVAPRVSPQIADKILFLIYFVKYIYVSDINNVMWIDEFRERLSQYKPNKSKVKDKSNNKMQQDVPRDQLGPLLKRKVADLGDIVNAFRLGDKSRRKLSDLNILNVFGLVDKSNTILPANNDNHKTKFAIEMIILEIMSILDSSDCLTNNTLFLDDRAPILCGKCLRNHLAHGNALFDLFFPDILITLFSNAKSLVENTTINIKRKIGKIVNHDIDKLKQKYDRGLQIISRQEEMSDALREGNLEDLKKCLKKVADTTSTSIHLWTSFHMAAQGPNLEVIKFLLEKNVKTEERNIGGQVPLHVAATFGRENILEFLVNEIGSPINVIDNIGRTPLHLAARSGHQESVKVLLSLGASHTVKDIEGNSPVHCAAATNRIDVVKVLLGKEINVDANNNKGFTCLHVAAEFGHMELVQYLLRNNADVNAKTLKGWRPLHLAALNGHVEVVNALINKGAQVNPLSSESGGVPLHYAAENSHEDVVNILLKRGAFVNIGDYHYNHTALHWAASNGHKRIVELLIQYKADVDVARYDGTTPLLFAAREGHLEVVELLVQNGSRKDNKDGNGFTALQLSIVHGHSAILRFLIERGFNIHIRDKHHMTPLHLAVEFDNQVAVDILLAEGADVKSASADGSTPLHLGALKGNEAVSEALIKMGAPLNAVNVNNFTPLHEAMRTHGNEKMIKLLIKHGADVNAKGVNNSTPLHLASALGHSGAVDVLIKNNAIVDAKISTGDTPLHLAAEGNHKAVVEILSKHDSFISNNISTALCYAVRKNYGDLVNTLIAKGADVNIQDGKPLKLAISAGHRSIVEVLLRNKNIDIDVSDHDGFTLLHYAALNGNWHIGKALISKGAKIDSETSDKITPLSVAIQRGHKEFVDLLLLNGADVNTILSENYSLMHITVSGGHPEIAETLLKSGSKHNIRDIENRTALELAVLNSQLSIVEAFFQHRDININERGTDNWTLLHMAAQSGNLDGIQFLLEKGADVNATNTLGSKPIHIAAREGFLKVVEYFLECGMSIHDEGAAGDTPLHYAAMAGRTEVARCLIGKGADINAVDHNGMLPIHVAAKEGQLEVLKILLQNGAIYDSGNKFNHKPAHLTLNKDISKILISVENLFKAVIRNDVSDIERLIKDGAPVNARNEDKATLLHLVCWKGYGEACDILLKNKANPDVTGKGGNTPLHYAAKFSHLKIAQSLLKTSAKYNTKTDNGKTPLDFVTAESITYLLKLVDRSFRKVKSGDIGIINDLEKIKDVDNIKAVMKARNEDGKSLLVVAINNNFPKVDMLKQILQEDITPTLTMVEGMLIKENFTEALCVLTKIMEERREILGEDNPGTLDVLESIATILYKQSKYSEALELHEEIYRKHLETLGPNNEDSLRVRSTIALIIQQQGKVQESVNILQDVYEKQKEILGENHLDVLKTRKHLALSLDALKKYEEALNMNNNNYEKCCKKFGAKNPFTLSVLNNIAMVLNNLGRHDEALVIYRKVCETRKTILGPNHSDTLRAMHDIAGVLMAQQKSDEAMKVFPEVFAIQKNVLGLKHSDTLYTQTNIGILSLSQNKLIDALRAFKAGAEQWKNMLAADHPINVMMDSIVDKSKIAGLDLDRIQSCQLAVITAASEGDIELLENLIQNGSDVDTADAEGRTPLHFATSAGHTDAVKVLLKRGADATAVSAKGNTPLHTAASRDCFKISELLLRNVRETKQIKFNDFINAKTVVGGASALHVACEKGYIRIVKCLLKFGASYNPADRVYNATPLQCSQSPDVICLLQLTRELFVCAGKGDTSIIKKLSRLDKGNLEAALNSRDEHLRTPLQVAIVNKHKIMVSSLGGILTDKR